MKNTTSNIITKRIRLSGMTVAGWSRVNKFALQSVTKVLRGDLHGHGVVGAKIIAALRRDGFWDERVTKKSLKVA